MKKSKFTESQILGILKAQESELAQYKRIVAEQSLQITVLKDVIEKKL
jgi:putative transposase